MLKRYQVLLPDWLEDYIKLGVETYGFSFSEIIRLLLCFSVLTQIPALDPEYTPNLTIEDILGSINKAASEHAGKKSFNSLVSQIYFETRKAIEYRMQKLEKMSKR